MSTSTLPKSLASFASLGRVMSHVFGVRSYLKIFYAIVFCVAVLMMDVLGFENPSTETFFHHKSMLHNVAVRIGVGMIGEKNLNIFSTITPTAFPIRMSSAFWKAYSAKLCVARSRASRLFNLYGASQSLKGVSTGRTNIDGLCYSFHGVHILSLSSCIDKGLL